MRFVKVLVESPNTWPHRPIEGLSEYADYVILHARIYRNSRNVNRWLVPFDEIGEYLWSHLTAHLTALNT